MTSVEANRSVPAVNSRAMVVLALLALNALMQLGGGAMMFFTPGQIATGLFHAAPTPELARVLAVLGGVTLGFTLLSGLSLYWVARGRAAGFTVAAIEGGMLALTGAAMLFTGTAAGAIDFGKGLLLVLTAWWAAPSADSAR